VKATVQRHALTKPKCGPSFLPLYQLTLAQKYY
jgi:hypothetical protein